MHHSAPPTTERRARSAPENAEAVVAWLESEFPGWSFHVADTATWVGDLQPIWIATADGHHPQSELTPAKLHTRLTEYLERQSRRRPEAESN